jgi:hypothetical protein
MGEEANRAERFIGAIEPIHGQWVWPFGKMEEGDWFIVSHELRDPEKLRPYAYLRGRQLGKTFNVTAHDPEFDGYCRITCVPFGMSKQQVDQVMTYGTAREHILAGYGLNLDAVPIWAFDEGIDKPVRVSFEHKADDARTRLVFKTRLCTAGMTVEGKSLVFQKLPHGTTLQSWRNAKIDEVMS